MGSLIDKKDCMNNGEHNSKVFTSCFPYKRFCYYCMTEEREDIGKNETRK